MCNPVLRRYGLLALILLVGPAWAETTEPTSSHKPAAAEQPAGDNAKAAEASPRMASNLPADVRVLIDVSGSMKQTDPKNLRKPAMDLIVRLLPDKSRAGVWTFGTSVNALVPLRPVDPNWRKQAAPKANEINSAAMFTNIGKALDEVSFDRSNLNPEYKTHIILLTDGVVDIGKDTALNNAERERILKDILPALKSAGYIIHTIALSADADADLLKRLSVATDGISTVAISADQLMSVFLKIFDQAVPAERVPLDKNGFLVDASIKEFTALIFRKPDNDRTVIAAPDDKEYSATTPADGINWYHTDKYDLITADAPKTGQWQIKTEIAPQSRITVVSNLQLSVEPLKTNIHVNDVLALNYAFKENGKTIDNKDFLSLLEANSIVAKDHTEDNYATDFPASIPADGVFRQTLNNFAETGDYEVHLYVDGKTFKREFKHSLSVRDSMFTLDKSNATAADGKLVYSYKITTDEKLVNVKKMQMMVAIKNPPNTINKTLTFIEPNRWEFSFSPVQSGDYQIDLHAVGEMLDSSKLDETLHADAFSYGAKAVAASSVAEAPKPAEEKPKEEAKTESNNLVMYIAIAVGNLLLALFGYLGYRSFLGSKAKNELAEFETTLNASKPGSKPAAGKMPDKAEIDLSDEDPISIPINDDASIEKLFPLDSMDDPNGRDDNNL